VSVVIRKEGGDKWRRTLISVEVVSKRTSEERGSEGRYVQAKRQRSWREKERRVNGRGERRYTCGRRKVLASTSVLAWAVTAAVTYLGGRCWKVSSLAAVGGRYEKVEKHVTGR
jgi:hypothetical protein